MPPPDPQTYDGTALLCVCKLIEIGSCKSTAALKKIETNPPGDKEMRFSTSLPGLLILLLSAPLVQSKPMPAATAASASSHAKSIEQDLLNGVITNRTITVLGWDFYQYFTAIWQAKYNKERFSLSIHERPTARWGSEIWIQYGQNRVFHIFLPPARSATKAVSMQAADLVYKSIVGINVQRSLYTDIDLAPEEM
jgi:curli production assembly/transport component CsgE